MKPKRNYGPPRQPLRVRSLGVAMFLVPTVITVASLDALHLSGSKAGTAILMVVMVAGLVLACSFYAQDNRGRSA